jgi:trans-aconitate methyltransferase
MPQSSALYDDIYRRDIVAEAEWLRMGAKAKVDSIDLLISNLSRPVGVLCEMGCGTGAVLEECIRRGLACNYIGVDASEDALSWIRRTMSRSVRLIRHDLDQGAPPLDAFPDLVVISHVIEHLNDPEVLLAALRGKCGWLIAEVPLENQPVPRAMACIRSRLFKEPRSRNRAGHVRFFSRASFRQLLAHCGWNIIAERMYLAYRKETIVYASRRDGSPLWRNLVPYALAKLLGEKIASHLLCVHYALLVRPL